MGFQFSVDGTHLHQPAPSVQHSPPQRWTQVLPGLTASPRSHHQQRVFHTQVQLPASLIHFLNQLGSPRKSVGTRHLPTLRIWSSSLALHPRPAALGEMCRVPAAYPPQPAHSSLSSSQRQHVQKKLDIVRRRSRQSGTVCTGTILATQQREQGACLL